MSCSPFISEFHVLATIFAVRHVNKFTGGFRLTQVESKDRNWMVPTGSVISSSGWH